MLFFVENFTFNSIELEVEYQRTLVLFFFNPQKALASVKKTFLYCITLELRMFHNKMDYETRSSLKFITGHQD